MIVKILFLCVAGAGIVYLFAITQALERLGEELQTLNRQLARFWRTAIEKDWITQLDGEHPGKILDRLVELEVRVADLDLELLRPRVDPDETQEVDRG